MRNISRVCSPNCNLFSVWQCQLIVKHHVFQRSIIIKSHHSNNIYFFIIYISFLYTTFAAKVINFSRLWHGQRRNIKYYEKVSLPISMYLCRLICITHLRRRHRQSVYIIIENIQLKYLGCWMLAADDVIGKFCTFCFVFFPSRYSSGNSSHRVVCRRSVYVVWRMFSCHTLVFGQSPPQKLLFFIIHFVCSFISFLQLFSLVFCFFSNFVYNKIRFYKFSWIFE